MMYILHDIMYLHPPVTLSDEGPRAAMNVTPRIESVQSDLIFRTTNILDLRDICAIQHEVYSQHLVEDEDTFSSIIQQGLSTVALCDHKIVAYILCHFSKHANEPPSLHDHVQSFLAGIDDAQAFFIHDLSVSKKYRNIGIAKALVQHTFSLHNLLSPSLPMSLVSVHDTKHFWSKLGFNIAPCRQHVIHSYGDLSASFMIKY